MPVNRIARSKMTHRCTIERAAAANDRYAPRTAVTWATLATGVPCYGWASMKTELVDADRTAVHADAHLILPLGTSLTERDRVSGVLTRDGRAVLAGVHNVLGVIPRATHIEALLKAHSG